MARKRKATASTAASVEEVTADTTTMDAAAADIDAIAALLDAESAAPVEDVASDEGELIDSVASEIDLADAKGEAYKSSTSEIDTSEEKSGDEKVVKTARSRAVKQPFEDIVMAYHKEEPLVLDAEQGEMTDAQVKELIASMPQKKVREKALQMFGNIMKDEKLSKYTIIALEVLKKAYLSGEVVTTAQLKKAYENEGYKPGTANAQQGQMMVLFSEMKLAERLDRSTLKPNPNSVLLEAYCS